MTVNTAALRTLLPDLEARDDIGLVVIERGVNLAAVTVLVEKMPALLGEVDALRTRLEMDFAWQIIDGVKTKVKVEPGSIPDGIDCRNETIKLQDGHIKELRGEVEGLRTALRRLAILKTVRMAYGGATVPNGGFCALCDADWDDHGQEHHTSECVLGRSAP